MVCAKAWFTRCRSAYAKKYISGGVIYTLSEKMDHSVLGMMHHTTFDNMGLYEQPKPRFIFKMPRVVPDQKAKFESDELFRRLSRESEVRYTAHRDRPQDERIKRFLAACQEGHTEIAFSATGTNLQLVFNAPNPGYMSENQCDFEKEQGKVNIKSSFIMNGVCVRWRGYVDLERLDGVGAIEFDEEAAMREDSILRDQMERYTQRLREYEDNKPRYRLDRPDQDEVRHIAGPSTSSMSMQMPYMKMY